MPNLEATGPNAEQIQYWNDIAGPKWVALQPLIDAQIRSLGFLAMARAALTAGERVLDVGCGCGHTTVEIARRVGPTGSVVGIDVSSRMLECARDRARSAGIANVRFDNADAQTHAFAGARFDVLFSRFGVMFFTDPTAAFANLRTALRPGGRLGFVCWRDLKQNPWMLVPLMAAAQHIQLPAPPPPGAPGPFAFADAERVRGILARAGFVDVSLDPLDEALVVGGGGDLDQTVDFLLQMGPAGAALREVGAEARSAVAVAVRDALRPFVTDAGVRLAGAAWVVTAGNPLDHR